MRSYSKTLQRIHFNSQLTNDTNITVHTASPEGKTDNKTLRGIEKKYISRMHDKGALGSECVRIHDSILKPS